MKKTLVLNKETLTRLNNNETQQVIGASTGCPSINVCSGRVCPIHITPINAIQ